jgi:ABC-type multidrug transport system fused ATPase/permease subunit
MDWMVLKSKFKEIDERDLSFDVQDSCQVVQSKFIYHWKEALRPSLVRTLLKCFYRDFVLAGIFKLMWSVLICLCAFYFVKELTSFVGEPEMPDWYGWVLCVGFLIGCVLLSICYQQMGSKAIQVGIRIRAALLQAVYEKALRLDLQDLNAGDVVNLAANDCSRLMESVLCFHYLWSGALEAFTIVGLLIYLMGNSGWAALGIVIILVIVQSILGYLTGYVRSQNINTTDERVSMMTEILLAIKLVKLYAWEDFFAKRVKNIRSKEVKFLSKGGLISTINLTIVYGVPTLIALSVFSIYVSTVGKLSASIAFTTLSLFNTLRFPLVVLPKALRGFTEFLAALSRLQAFLLQPEIEPHKKDPNYRGLKMENASFSFLRTDTLLHNLTFEISPGKLCALVGLVGSGKSNLVLSILGQMRLTGGNYKVGGSIGYVPQTPWIQSGTIRDNILFGLPYDEERYRKTVFACCLERDFETMEPFGDLTYLSDRGQNLSGGQKQRIALARAVYANADLYVLDSPLSAVDQHTAKHIFDHCIRGMLKSKACLLITHHLELLPDCDLIAIMSEGRMSYFGEWNDHCNMTVKRYFTHWVYESKSNAEVQQDKDDVKVAPIEMQGKDVETLSVSSVETLNKKENDSTAVSAKETLSSETEAPSQLTKKIPFSGHLIWIYENGVFLVIISFSIFAITQVARIMSDKWVSWWSSGMFGLPEKEDIWIYSILISSFIGLSVLRGLVYYFMVLRASSKLHNRMFKKILRAPMLFFNEIPVGRILNCFSKDQDCADVGLADTIHVTLIYLMILLTTVIIICTVLPYYTIVLVLLFLSFFVMYFLYSSTAQYLKELSGTTNSNLFSHLNESLTGLPVIRAFEKEKIFVKSTSEKIDANHMAIFNAEMLQLWLSFRLDFVSSILVFITAMFAVIERSSVSPSSFGLAISNSFQQLVFFTWVVRGFADINSQISCIERISYYARNTSSEAPAHIKETEPPPEWPSKGSIEINDLVLRYKPTLEPALRSLSLKINGGEKIGVVGRTGSGKTTLLMSLFRLIEPDSGTIVIDGLDISKMGLNDLRKRLAIIPQEPVLFKGTIRSNLDPFDQYSDKELWEAIKYCDLKDDIESMPMKLETPVFENGSNYSLGQKQLFCLARAALNQSKLLVFDEATAAMDLETDSKIQSTIRQVFADRTILTIAHRLDTIIDSDRILVMEAGNIVEFDSPAALLSNPNGAFTKLVEQTGPDSAASLKKIAFSKKASV